MSQAGSGVHAVRGGVRQDADSASYGPRASPGAAIAPGRREQVVYIELFRGLAIILIVLGHCYTLAGGYFDDRNLPPVMSWQYVVPTLIDGGTSYFVFISGFLYRQVFFGRVPYGDFMKKKALYVGLPYLLLASPVALAEIVTGIFYITAVKDGQAYPDSPFIEFVALMATGRMVTAYWYIPFAMLLFAAAPLFDRFILLRFVWQRLAVFGAFLGLALWLHRPASNLDPVHSLLYFTNVYLFGLLFWEHRDRLMPVLVRTPVLLLLACAIVAVAAAQTFLQHSVGNLERGVGDGFWPLGFDYMLAQKYLAIFFLCGLLARWGRMFATPLRFMAGISFGVYFIHGIIIAVLTRLAPVLSLPHSPNAILDLAVYGGVVLLLSVAVTLGVRRVAGKRSRYIIGA
jgi:membrane-bound acyltransferase YfiQ involved in biofilm formation